MRWKKTAVMIALCFMLGAFPAQAIEPKGDELETMWNWSTALLDGIPPVSFVYGERDSSELLPAWERTETTETGADGRVLKAVSFRDPETGLVMRIEATVYSDFPAIEWVVRFRNDGDAPTPILEAVNAVDLVSEFVRSENVTLHFARGSVSSAEDFAPRQGRLSPGANVRLTSFGGRPSDGYLPFFNIEGPDRGIIMAIGWTGQWEATFSRSTEGQVRVRAGMEGTHLRLFAGEEIRTPSVALIHWEGDDRLRGHNMLRRFILAHHTPRPGGNLLEIPVLFGTMGWDTAQEQIDRIRKIGEIDLPVDYYWIDAGWYGEDGEWVVNTGNWYPNAKRFPDGLEPVAEALREEGIEFGLWIEPERVMPGTKIYNEHPDWLLAPVNLPPELRYQNDWRLLNLGHPEALEWVIEYVSSMVESLGLAIYRQDFNMHPLYYWKSADAPDRQGITQIRHVEGLYAFWDALLERHPHLIIDNCASGGRRIDLESISRSVPLWRSDFHSEATRADFEIGSQAQTYGLSLWIPLSGQGSGARVTTYAVRSAMTGGLILGGWSPYSINPLQGQELLNEVKAVRPYFFGDFYPLTPYTLADDVWFAYQFHRPDLDEGIVLAFRRSYKAPTEATFHLGGLDDEKTYTLTFVDAGSTQAYTGEHLKNEGFTVRLPMSNPYALLYTYRATQ